MDKKFLLSLSLFIFYYFFIRFYSKVYKVSYSLIS